MHLASNTVASNSITIYCTEKLADVTTETLSFTASDAVAGAKQTLTGTVLAGIFLKLSSSSELSSLSKKCFFAAAFAWAPGCA